MRLPVSSFDCSAAPTIKPARSYCGFAANQGTAVLFAGAGYAGDDRRGNGGIQLAGGKVIEEKQRCRALDRNVVDAMIYQVLADGVMAPGEEREFDFSANAIGAAHQHRTAKAREPVRGAKRSDIGQNAPRERPARQPFDCGYGAIRLVNIDSGVFIVDLLVIGQIISIRCCVRIYSDSPLTRST
jgi:hypothetical protein